MVMQGLQKRLHTLMYHHGLNKFDMVAQGSKTIQELMDDLTKYATQMIQLPDDYTFQWWSVSALQETLHKEVLKKGYNTESSLIDQLYKTAHMIEEPFHYNVGMQQADSTATTAASTPQLALNKQMPQMGPN